MLSNILCLRNPSLWSPIIRKLANLYPKENNIVAAKIDQFIDILTDITTIITSTEVERRDATFLDEVKRKLFILNKSIDEKHDYIVNNYFSIADIAIWSFVCWLTGGNIAAVPKDIAKNYTNMIEWEKLGLEMILLKQ